jgi:N-ethylmaleimide reductase
MTHQDIQNAINDFKEGAQRAKNAGFDGVEIHGANGYLVDSFLRSSSNIR